MPNPPKEHPNESEIPPLLPLETPRLRVVQSRFN